MLIRRIFILSITLFLITKQNCAQTGPGGVGTSATNVLWLKAESEVYNNAGTTLASTTDNVQQWNDQSGNAKNALQAVVANRPNYFTNVINGLPAIRFSATNNDLILSAGVSTANLASVWAIASYASLPSSNPGILIASPAGSGTTVATSDKCIGIWVSSGAGTQVWGRGIQSNNTQQNISAVTTLNSNTFYIINNIYGTAQIDQYVNNTIAGNNTAHNGTLRSWTDVTVGRQANESWNGDIAEVIFYNVEVNSAQRIIIDNYLAAKYGLTLSSNDIYNKDTPGNGNYDFDVAGIGRVDAGNIHSAAQGSGIVRVLNPTGLGNNEFLIWGHDNGTLQATNVADVPSGVQARIARTWRVSEVNASSTAVSVGNIDIQFDLANLGSVTASDLRLIVDTNNDGVFTDETGISGATLVGGTVYQFSGVSAITNNVRFSLGTINKVQTPLPIELVSFTASFIEGKYVELMWTTATEKNNEYFEVQRSIDGLDWETITSIIGAGNSSTWQKYSFIDEHPYNLKSYYRINQVDLDTRSTQSPIVVVDLEGKLFYNIDIYPNPTSGELTIQGNSLEIDGFQIYDRFGREINLSLMISYINNHKIILDLSSLPSDIYILKTKNEVRKIIKTN
ncbi:T9SS type A sorting domain-containing protein [Aurantibacillus circumpalustris]|uniref:T9SS type A sorting domain-containing protein n=1 Tax=Aurantibacillus circumpalustris TaxID=3036359 RepID=UPI00295B9A9D|nr:T9SS type A sorting domain-containing protein [Aurantibacillus circumpalustris]